MASLARLTRKSSCKRDSDVKENAHLPRSPSRSNSNCRSVRVRRSLSLSSLKSRARSFSSHMQLVPTKSNSDPQDQRPYGKLTGTSPPESTQGDDDSDGQSTTEENVHVQRAAACCLATYYSIQEAREWFKEHELERLNFKEVYLSPLPLPEEEGCKQNVLVATAVDGNETSVYVAFRGNSNLAEVFSDVCDSSEVKVFQESPLRCALREEMGSYHKNFCNRLSEQVPRIDGLLEFCRSLVVSSLEKNSDVQNEGYIHSDDHDSGRMRSPLRRTRLIFCGHSLGGALSHLATVTYLLSIFRDTGDVLKHQSEEDCMSITFGAPLVFDKKAATFLQTNFPVHNRFLNFFQAKDPVPFILARAPISHQLQEHFQQLKTKNAASLMVTGRFLVDRKLGKSQAKQPETRSGSVSSERGPKPGKRRKARKGEKGDPESVSKSVAIKESSSFRESPVVTAADDDHHNGKDVNPVAPAAPSSGTKKSNIGKKVSESFQTVKVTGKEFIRRVTHGGKKAKVNMESKLQMWHLEADVRKAKLEPSDELSVANSFAPFGVYKRLCFDLKTRSHVAKVVKPEQIVDYDFKLRKNHLKRHKIGTYFFCLVEQGSTGTSHQQSQVSIREGPLPQMDKAELILIRCETSEKLKGARIIAKGKYLSLALEHKCQVTTFSDKWRLVAADSSSIIFETLRATDGKNVYVSQGELIELARVGQGNRATSVSVETVFGRNSGEFCPVLLRDLAADSAVIDGLKHSVGKILVLLDTDGPRGGEAGLKILHHLQRAADLTGLRESFSMIVQLKKGTVHAKKTMIDKGFIAQLSYALCYKPITLVFEFEGARKIEEAAQIIRQQPFTFFSSDRGHNQLHSDPFIKSLNLRTTPLKYAEGQVRIELDSYDHILRCLHALVVPDKHAATYNGGTDSDDYASLIKTYERELYEAVREFYEGEVLRKDRLMENWFPGLDERSCASLRKRLELLYFLTSAFQVAKEQKLLALIGPENAGKSTVANLLGCKSKESTGYMVHTADMKSYRLAPDLLAVDFPGTDAPGARSSLSTIWEAFAKLPDRCIVVTPFTGDVTEGSQELPRLAAQKLCPEVMLLVNRVDGILKGPPKAKIWKQYNKETVENLHEKFMHVNEMGGVNLKDVILCSLDEEDIHDSDMEQLKDRGIIFSKEVRRRILQWIRGPSASVSGAPDAVTAPASTETSNRVYQHVGGHGTERKSVRATYNSNSNSVDDASKPKSSTRPTSHRANFKFLVEKRKAEGSNGVLELSDPKARALVSLDVKASSSTSIIPKPTTSLSESSKSYTASSLKTMASPADSNQSSSNHKLIASSSESSKSSDYQHADQDGSSLGSRNDTGHSTISESTSPSLKWFSETPSDLDNPFDSHILLCPDHTTDPFGRRSASESSTPSVSFDESLRNDDYRSLDQGGSWEADVSEGFPTTSSSTTSTATSLSKQCKGQFVHQVSQRAVTITADQSVQESSASKTANQQGSKRVGNKKSSGGSTPVFNPAWKP